MPRTRNLMFLYLGRRGAMAHFTLELARALGAGDGRAHFLISSDNELAPAFGETGANVRFARVFSSGAGAVLEAWRAPGLRRAVRDAIVETGADTVVELMPHVWSPLLEGAIRGAGARRVALLHDWSAHPGDASGAFAGWLAASALRADKVATLSRFVGARVRAARPACGAKLIELFHPDFDYGVTTPVRGEAPLRVLFMGRLATYKGLDLFAESTALARAQGADIEVSVCGAGALGPLRARLEAMGARVVNHWLSDAEIAAALASADVVAATHTEASQSGIVAAAFGAGRPVLATPVGALPEQVAHERTGLVAARAEAGAVAAELARLARDPALVRGLAETVRREAPQRSMRSFARALSEALG